MRHVQGYALFVVYKGAEATTLPLHVLVAHRCIARRLQRFAIRNKHLARDAAAAVNILQRAGFQVEDIAKIYLSGMWCESKFVEGKVYEFIG